MTEQVSERTSAMAPDTRGQNFFEMDRSLRQLLSIYVEPGLLKLADQSLHELGNRAANKLDECAMLANRHVPVLHHRDRFGSDVQWIEYHPSYRVLEQAAFGDFAMHAMSHRPTLNGYEKPLPATLKHAYTFLFNQAEFGLGCPINVTDSAIHLIRRFGSAELQERFLPNMLTNDLARLWQGAQFITEQSGGSDVGRIESVAVYDNDEWRVSGDKWFCSNVDAEVAMLLARHDTTEVGTKALGLFLLPRTLADGSANSIKIVRLKDKFGTRSMASGEIRLEGAKVHLVGDINRGFQQMVEMINWSRLSNGVKSSALMRRAVHDARIVSSSRQVFGKSLDEQPLGRLQLFKVMLASEQALSMWMFVAGQLDRSENARADEQEHANAVLRLATPILKMRATRDARQVVGDAMEIRGGSGYIEEFINPRLVRDAHLGSIWEGTSNIIAIDAMFRAVGRSGCLPPYVAELESRLSDVRRTVPEFAQELADWLERVRVFVDDIVQEGSEHWYRKATSSLYHVSSAVLLAWEGSCLAATQGDASRLLWSRLVVDQKLTVHSAVSTPPTRKQILDVLIQDIPVPLNEVKDLLH